MLLFLVAAGCKPGGEPSGSAPVENPPGETVSFFVDWLKRHGEKNVVVDSRGVGLAGNATRLKASQYGIHQTASGQYSVELEFRIALPSGEQIVEYLAGVGDDATKATHDSMANFILTTFHVVYKSFMNAADPHQTIEEALIDGKNREMARGDVYMRGQKGTELPEAKAFADQLRSVILRQHLDARPHWFKIVYGQMNGKPMTVAATRDNHDDIELTKAIEALSWPSREEFYMVKQFIVIK
jgi:hypothetical protein